MAAKASLSEQTDALLKSKIGKGNPFPGEELFDDMAKAMKDYKVFYLKGSLDDESFITLLEKIETQGLQGDEIVLLSQDTFTCDTEYFVVLKYMQKIAS